MAASRLPRVGRWALASAGGAAAVVAVLLTINAAPRVPFLSDADVRRADQPFVVKLHARWCPLCMATRGVWSEIEKAYAGRVRFVVFDFTNDATTRASELDARRIGLGALFDEYVGETGTILVLNGASNAVIGDLHGERDFEPYRVAIDEALLVAAR